MFHHFHDRNRHFPGQGSLSQETFEDLLQFVGVERILNPDEWLTRLQAGDLAPEDLCLTFDDGLLCQYEIALPVLQKYHRKAFWFVYSSVFEGHLGKFEIYRYFRTCFFKEIDDFYEVFFDRIFQSGKREKARDILEGADLPTYRKSFPFYSLYDIHFRLIRDQVLSPQEYETLMDCWIEEHGTSPIKLSKNLWMSNEHLRFLSGQGHQIGLHSYSHPMALARLSYEDQRVEYQRNYEHILRACGRKPLGMAHPANSYNENTFKILDSFGIRCGFRSTMVPSCDGNSLNPNKFEWAREDPTNIVRMRETRPYENQQPQRVG